MITIIGSLNYDLVTYTNRVPEAGETVQANSFENHLGGKGLNEAIACARLSKDTTVRMIGKIGEDSFGKELKGALIESGVDTTYVLTVPNKSSGVAVILVESDGENRILITPGANGELKPTSKDYEKYFEQYLQNDFVLLQNEFPDTIKLIEWIKQNRANINICYNPSPYNPDYIKEELLSKIDLLILNEGEALDVASSILEPKELEEHKQEIQKNKTGGFQQLSVKLQRLINQKNISTVIITMGSVGSIFKSKEEVQFRSSIKVEKVVDTTGAGDTFFGGVVVALSEGKLLKDAVSFGTLASSVVIQRNGAAGSIPRREDL